MIPIGSRFLFKTSDGFNWNGETRWWEFFAVVVGYNGAGGYWIREESGWNGGSVFIFHSRTLDCDQSRRLEDAYVNQMKSAPVTVA